MATEVYAGMMRQWTPQMIQPLTWTVVTYDTVLGNPPGWTDLSNGLFTPEAEKRAIVLAFVHFNDPGPDVQIVQGSMRLCRDPYDDFKGPNTTCTDERGGTPGRQFWGGYAWTLVVKPHEPLALQVHVTARRVRTVQVMTEDLEAVPLVVPTVPEELVSVEISNAEFKLVVP